MRGSTRQSAAVHAAAPRRGLALGLLCLAPFLGIFDTTAVVIALPAMQRDLGFSTSGVQWVLNAYTLALGGLLLLGGRIADTLGRRRVFMAGLGIFALASLAASVAVAPWMLVVARVLQGIGAATVGPASLSLITTTFPDPIHRNRAIGVFGAVGGVAWIAGTILGGALTELLSWRWVLFVGAPLALAGLLGAPSVVPESRDPGAPRSLDLLGATSATLGVAALIYTLSEVPARGWSAPATLAFGMVGLVLLSGFVAVECRHEAPLVPLSVFRVRAVTIADAGMLLKSGAAMAQLYVLTLYFQQVRDRSPLETGLLFVPMALADIAAAPIAGALVIRWGGVRPTALLGLTLMIAGLLIMTRLPLADGLLIVLAGAIILEIGFQFSSVPLTIASTAGLAETHQGLAAGLLQTATNFGNALGLGVVATMVAAQLSTPGGDATDPTMLTTGLRYGLLAAIAFVAAAALLVLVALPGQTTGQDL